MTNKIIFDCDAQVLEYPRGTYLTTNGVQIQYNFASSDRVVYIENYSPCFAEIDITDMIDFLFAVRNKLKSL
jgi:hypothetical protein